MQPLTITLTVVTGPNGENGIQIGASKPLDRDSMLRILNHAMGGVLNQPPPQPLIETAAPEMVETLLNGAR